MHHMPHIVYMLECADGSLYTGCTNDMEKRLHAHNHTKTGAKYTSARRPVNVVFSETYATLAQGRKREAEIKRLTRQQKIELIVQTRAK